jgi:hypothetical protein
VIPISGLFGVSAQTNSASPIASIAASVSVWSVSETSSAPRDARTPSSSRTPL